MQDLFLQCPTDARCDYCNGRKSRPALADTLDAITSNRPYRSAQTLGAARIEIEKWSGRQFDPEVVRMFLSMPENTWADLRREIDAQNYRFAYSTPAKASS